MNLILLGLPGAGKGTQAKKISQEFKIPHISTGDMFRKAIKEETVLGKQVKAIIAKGKLVPDELTIELVKSRLKHKDCQKGFILDGFPRTSQQAEILPDILQELGKEIDIAFYIEVQAEDLIQRISARRSCSQCGASYNLDYNPPKTSGKCDQCNGQLIQRSDDRKATVKKRIFVNQKEMKKLLNYYQQQGILQIVDGNVGMNKVFSQIKEIIEAKDK